jgi:V/A-type H+-transporting ATPase subunit E
MTQDLQQLLEKINTDGVEKAKAEATKIISQAETEAKATLDAAKREADKVLAQARQETAAYQQRTEETIRQAARDTILTVEKAVTTLLTNLLLKDVNLALTNEDVITPLVSEAVRAYIHSNGGLDIVVASDKLAQTLRSKLAAEAANGVKVITDDHMGAGFKVRLANGRVEHDFSGAAVAEALGKNLRPQLAALLKG